MRFTPAHLAALIQAAEEGTVNNRTAKEIFEKIFDEDVEPMEYIRANDLATVADSSLLEEAADRVIQANPGSVEEYLGGKEKVMGFFLGQIMKEMKGKADPKAAQKIVKQKLEERKKS